MCACDSLGLGRGSARCMGAMQLWPHVTVQLCLCDHVHKNECYVCGVCESQRQVLRASGRWVDGDRGGCLHSCGLLPVICVRPYGGSRGGHVWPCGTLRCPQVCLRV